MGELLHQSEGTSAAICVSLDDIRDAIIDEVDGMVMRVGEWLWIAKQQHPRRFIEWVETELPFGRDTARRLIGIYLAYRMLPAETLAQLPRPWQALFALRRIPAETLTQAVAAGELGPATTRREAEQFARRWKDTGERRHVQPRFSRADLVAARLMTMPADSLSHDIAEALAAWLGPRPFGQ